VGGGGLSKGKVEVVASSTCPSVADSPWSSLCRSSWLLLSRVVGSDAND
jgi:hypothetical protein